MAHEVESMFSVKETPWHKLGVIVQEAPTTEEAIKIAGLNWPVLENKIYREVGEGQFMEVSTHKVLTRGDNDFQLGVVGKGYHPLQNEKAFNFFDPFVEQGLAQFETAGSLREGKTVFILAKLNKDPMVIQGDVVEKFLLLSNGHDGSMAVRVGFTPIRVVCANTLAMSHNNTASQLIRVNHSSAVEKNLDKLQEIVNTANQRFEATAEQYKALSRKDVNSRDLEKYVKLVFPFQQQDEERRKLAEQKAVEDIKRIFETGYGMNQKKTKRTWWMLYNSVAEYLSYERGRDDSRLNSLWFGDSQLINLKAFEKAKELSL